MKTNPFENKVVQVTYSLEDYKAMKDENRELYEKAAANDFKDHLTDLLGDLWSEEKGYGEASSARTFLGIENGKDPLKKKKDASKSLAKSQLGP